MDHAALALSLSLAGLAEMTVLLVVLRRRLGPLLGALAGSLWRTVAATAVMAALLLPIAGALAVVTDPASGRGLDDWFWLLSAMGWGAVGYLTTAVLIGSPEATAIWRLVARRARR
jgi:peptidoglycan biosynthesis protein MviN/MurJ (putative lipid II flippase)